MGLISTGRYPITIEGQTALIGTANELAVALDVLQGQFDREALEQLQPHLAEIIANAAGLSAVLKVLAPEDQVFLIKSLGIDLAGVLKDAGRLRDLLAVTAQMEVEEALLSTLGTDGLQRLIFTAEQLAEVLEWVYGECDALALDLLGIDTVRQLCRSAAGLSAVLRSLGQTQQTRMLEQLGWAFITGLVRDGRDLAYLLRALPADISEQLLRCFSASQLRAMIGNAQDWAYLYQRLEPAEAEFLTGFLKAQ